MSPSSQIEIPEADITAAWAYADQHADGYLYALHFTGADGDVVKVGRTTDLETRFKNHNKQAKAMRLELVEQWVSEPHINILTSENVLIGYCRERWPLAAGLEWFRADFAEVVEFASEIRKVKYTETHRKVRAANYLAANYPVVAALDAVGFDPDLEEVER